jgi:ubiquinone/menaquinone biosynthesis C-methylase UbiE
MTSRSSNPTEAFPRSPAYSRYASVYDAIGQRIFGELIAEATLDFLREAGLHPATVIDLACGTGSASLIFAASGMRVTGIDRSSAMLDRARKAAEDAGLPVTWIEQDMRAFETDRQVALVTCFYDAVNYLTEPEEVAEVFDRVAGALLPGGLFVFDMNTRAKFSAAWNETCFVAIDRDDLFGIYQSWFQAESGLSPLTMTFFVRSETGQWERFDEEHIERAYPLDEVQNMLQSAGFDVRAMLDYPDRFPRFGGPGSERSHRVVFIAERRP